MIDDFSEWNNWNGFQKTMGAIFIPLWWIVKIVFYYILWICFLNLLWMVLEGIFDN